MTQPVRRRTRAREVALQLLYQFDVRGEGYGRELGRELAAMVADGSGEDDEVRTFALRLVQGTLAQRDAIDLRLKGVTRNWDLKRMAVIDRNVLRMAVYELTSCPDIPPKVTINEAIELGKKFSTANSGGFVNGILDRIRLDLQQEAQQRQEEQQRTAEQQA
jgi:transcription antitermination factor NusB